MPTSNGQVGRYDIRQQAITEPALRDAIISTAKLQTLAVTIEKTDDPVFSYAVESEPFHNPTLTTTPTLQTSVSVALPTWVGQVSVFAVANVQMSNSSGANKNVIVEARINGEYSGGRQMTVADGTTGSLDHFTVFDVAAPGSTVTAEVWVWVNSGTNSANNGACWTFVLGTR